MDKTIEKVTAPRAPSASPPERQAKPRKESDKTDRAELDAKARRRALEVLSRNIGKIYDIPF